MIGYFHSMILPIFNHVIQSRIGDAILFNGSEIDSSIDFPPEESRDDYFELFKKILDPFNGLISIDDFQDTHQRDVLGYMQGVSESNFDRISFDSFTQEVFEMLSNERPSANFESSDQMGYLQPHCDGGVQTVKGEEMIWPGGSYSKEGLGFNLVQWLTDIIMKPLEGGADSSGSALGSLLGMLALQNAAGIVSLVAAILIEVIPPKIPPPPWLLMNLPCMPMILGMNCLGSVIYPITMADFIMSPQKDKVMVDHVDGFPQKYYERFGPTSWARYQLCARAYLGLMCADTFYMCFVIPGQPTKASFPPCLPQCIMTLLACPGFTLEDIMPMCSRFFLPPFCSFSLYVRRLPPMYGSFEDGHPFDNDCPPPDPTTTDFPEVVHHLLLEGEALDAQEENEQDAIDEHGEKIDVVGPIAQVKRIRRVPKCSCDTLCDPDTPRPPGCPPALCSCPSYEHLGVLLPSKTSSHPLRVHWNFGRDEDVRYLHQEAHKDGMGQIDAWQIDRGPQTLQP